VPLYNRYLEAKERPRRQIQEITNDWKYKARFRLALLPVSEYTLIIAFPFAPQRVGWAVFGKNDAVRCKMWIKYLLTERNKNNLNLLNLKFRSHNMGWDELAPPPAHAYFILIWLILCEQGAKMSGSRQNYFSGPNCEGIVLLYARMLQFVEVEIVSEMRRSSWPTYCYIQSFISSMRAPTSQ
jgi:hypothetical protein